MFYVFDGENKVLRKVSEIPSTGTYLIGRDEAEFVAYLIFIMDEGERYYLNVEDGKVKSVTRAKGVICIDPSWKVEI